MATILDTREMAARGRASLAGEVAQFRQQTGAEPALVLVSVGHDASVDGYVRVVAQAGEQVGVRVSARALPASASEAELTALLDELNAEAGTHGVSLQLPLPPHLKIEMLATRLAPDKDVEGYHPLNTQGLSRTSPRLAPPPAIGALEILDAFAIDPAGCQTVVVGRNPVIGRPLAVLLQQAGASVAVAHRQTPNLARLAGIADLLVLGASIPRVLSPGDLKPGAVVLDFGINYTPSPRHERPRITGNLDLEAALPIVGAITPMPGGTGPMTTLNLLRNTLKAARLQVPAAHAA